MSKNKREVINSFSQLTIVENEKGELQITTTQQVEDYLRDNDPLNYLNNSLDLLGAFKEQSSDEWLVDQPMGIISRTVFLESGWLSDSARKVLNAKDHSTEWLANQGLMMAKAPMLGIRKNDMVILAKCLDSMGNPKHPQDVSTLSLNSFAKNCIDDIWVWEEVEGHEDGGVWKVHMDLVNRYSYNHLTDAEEGAVVAYYKRLMADKGLVILSGFNAFKKGYRYCLVMPNLDFDGNQIDVDETSTSLWNYDNKQVKVGFPRFV